MKMSPCQGSFYQVSYNSFLFFFFSANEDCLDLRGDALQRNTRAPLLAEARVAVQFAALSMLSLHLRSYGEGACCLGISTPDTSSSIQ